ncbi:MAG: twin-arginine translocase subunit TatC [Gaiellaceae bacterium]
MLRLPRRLGHREETSVVDHLDELRNRLIVVVGALALGTAVAFAFHGQILSWMERPLPLDHRHLVTFGVAEPFTVSVTVSVYAGFLLALPVILWQTWAFLAPAFDLSTERRALALAAFAGLLAALGLAFGYEVLLPRAIHWLTNYDQSQFHILIRAKDYLSFVSTVLLGIVFVFELPVVIVGLVQLGALTSRTLRRNRRIGYFIVAVAALTLPGPDPVTTALELLPMWLLFEGSIWLAVATERRAAKATRLEAAEGRA